MSDFMWFHIAKICTAAQFHIVRNEMLISNSDGLLATSSNLPTCWPTLSIDFITCGSLENV